MTAPTRPAGVTVAMMLDELGAGSTAALQVELLAGSAGLDRRVTNPYPQKTGLALSGFDAAVRGGRVLVFGESEIRYLESLTSEARDATLARLYSHDIPAVLITQGFEPPIALAEAAERIAVPLLRTPNGTPHAMSRLGSVLDNLLAPRTTIHGVLMDILGLGVLMIGESGIGKSECALDLIVRGHRLVADDTVEVRRRAETILIGTCPDLTRHHMELRGLGVINVKDLFGIASTRSSKRVELVVQLERWDPTRAYERLGLDDEFSEVLGLRVPLIRMPVAPGRNIAILVEVAARNQILRSRGHHAARALATRLEHSLRRAAVGPPRDEDEEDEELEAGGGR